jgi:hypothetical protein
MPRRRAARKTNGKEEGPLMRWLKHLSLAHKDEDMEELLDKFGVFGYGLWWLILERIACGMDETDRTSVRMSKRNWCTLTRNLSRNKPKTMMKVLRWLHDKGKLKITETPDYLTIECPKILKYRDEYTGRLRRKSGEGPDKLQTDSGHLSGATPVRAEQSRAEKRKELKAGPVDNVDNSAPLTPARGPSNAPPAERMSFEVPEVRNIMGRPERTKSEVITDEIPEA